MKDSWQLQQPLDAVIFDCDGTLSYLEGIDELAVQNGVGDSVKAITSDAMSHSGVTSSIYKERLNLVKPTRKQVEAMGQAYFERRVPDVQSVIAVLQQLGKKVFVISAGIQLAVDIFAEKLGVPAAQVYAVSITFDDAGCYQDFDLDSPLTVPGGKGVLLEKIKQELPALMHVGDGVNDLDAKDHVVRFIGYGGVFFRESIMAQSDFYIQSESLAPVLALALTEAEAKSLEGEASALYQKGVALVNGSEVILS